MASPRSAWARAAASLTPHHEDAGAGAGAVTGRAVTDDRLLLITDVTLDAAGAVVAPTAEAAPG